MTIEKLVPPWNEAQVSRLNEYQASAGMHPFTCPNRDMGHPWPFQDRDRGILLATRDGWVCAFCDYTQKWAWPWMTSEHWFAP